MKRVGVEAVVQLSDTEWDAALAQAGNPFRFSHRAAAAQAFGSAYASYSDASCRVDFADGVSALFPLVRVSRRLGAMARFAGLPLGWEGTPVALSGNVRLEHIAGAFRALGGRGGIEIHGGAGSSPPGASPHAHATHVLELGRGFDALWTDAFSSRSRNSCRKAANAGIEVARRRDPGAIDLYYELYAAASKAWGYGEPPYPRALFHGLLVSDHAELWLASLEGRVIAGALMLEGSDDLFYWSGALDREFQGVAPSNAIIEAAIRSACERGLRYFDFGASGALAGVEKFKISFGAEARGSRSLTIETRTARGLEWCRVRVRGKRE